MSAAQSISQNVQDPKQLTGLLLVASFGVLLLALIILVASGALSAFSAGLQGSLAERAPHEATFRLLNLLWTAGWVFNLMGFSLLAHLLLRASDEFLVIPAFTAVLVAAIVGVLHGTFHMSVETWAASETVQTGSTPLAYEPLRIWIGSAFRVAYILELLGTVGFGWILQRTRILPTWIGRTMVGWGLFWLAGYLVGVGLPAVLFVIPAVLGIVLLIDSGRKPV